MLSKTVDTFHPLFLPSTGLVPEDNIRASKFGIRRKCQIPIKGGRNKKFFNSFIAASESQHSTGICNDFTSVREGKFIFILFCKNCNFTSVFGKIQCIFRGTVQFISGNNKISGISDPDSIKITNDFQSASVQFGHFCLCLDIVFSISLSLVEMTSTEIFPSIFIL